MSGLPSEDYMAAHWNDDRTPVIYGVCAMLTVLCTIAVSMRFWARFIISRNSKIIEIGADDYLAVVSLLLLYGLCAETFVVAYYGIGKRFFTLTPYNNEEIAKGFLAFELNYPLLTFGVKLTVLMMYRRIFTMVNRVFKIGWWFNAFLAFAYTLALIADTLTQCKTVPELWQLDHPPEDCRTGSAVSLYVFAGLNGLSDILILSLPVPIVWRLQMPTSKKIAVSGIFFLGFIAILISFIRIYSLESASGSTADPTYDQVDGLIWTVAEPATGLICSCLPILRPALVKVNEKYHSSRSRLFSRGQGTTSSATTNTTGQYGNTYQHNTSSSEFHLNRLPSIESANKRTAIVTE